mgnify:CR=1 FL=1
MAQAVYLWEMEQILQQIEAYKSEMAAFEATTPDAVEAFRIKYLGTKGLVKSVLGEMKKDVDLLKAGHEILKQAE